MLGWHMTSLEGSLPGKALCLQDSWSQTPLSGPCPSSCGREALLMKAMSLLECCCNGFMTSVMGYSRSIARHDALSASPKVVSIRCTQVPHCRAQVKRPPFSCCCKATMSTMLSSSTQSHHDTVPASARLPCNLRPYLGLSSRGAGLLAHSRIFLLDLSKEVPACVHAINLDRNSEFKASAPQSLSHHNKRLMFKGSTHLGIGRNLTSAFRACNLPIEYMHVVLGIY